MENILFDDTKGNIKIIGKTRESTNKELGGRGRGYLAFLNHRIT